MPTPPTPELHFNVEILDPLERGQLQKLPSSVLAENVRRPVEGVLAPGMC